MKLSEALMKSTIATEENTKIYRDTLVMHEKMDNEIADIKEEMIALKSDMEDLKENLSNNQIEMIKRLNELTEKYDKLSISLNDKLDILLEKNKEEYE